MDRLGAGFLRDREDLLDGEIRLARGRGSEEERAVGEAYVTRRGVGLGVDGDRLDAETARGAGDPAGDFATVGDEEGSEHGHPHIRKTPNCVGSMGAFSVAARERPRTRRLSAGSSTPSSQSRAVA